MSKLTWIENRRYRHKARNLKRSAVKIRKFIPNVRFIHIFHLFWFAFFPLTFFFDCQRKFQNLHPYIVGREVTTQRRRFISILILPKDGSRRKVFVEWKGAEKIDNSILGKTFCRNKLYAKENSHAKGKPNLLTRLECYAHAIYWPRKKISRNYHDSNRIFTKYHF